MAPTLWHEIFAEVYFCGMGIFCVLGELVLKIMTDWFFLMGINLIHIFATNNYSVHTLCKTSITLYTVLFLNDRDKL